MNASEKTGSPLDSPQSQPPICRVPGPLLALVRRFSKLTVLATVLAGSALATATAVQPGERVNTLFYSPAERTSIERSRQGQEQSAAPVNNLMTVNGVVKRNHGNSTAWVNGQAIQEGQPAPPANRVTTSGLGATLDGRPVRVGETLDLSTQERSDIVAPGAVTIRRSK